MAVTTTRHAPLIYVTVRDVRGNKERVLETTTRIKKLEYTDSLKAADKCVLTVENFDLSNFDDPVWSHGNFVQVSWGYPGNMSLARELVITKVKGFTDLQVEARAKSVLIDAVKKSRTFKAMTRSEIARQIASEYGYDAESTLVDDTEQRVAHITQAGLSDAQFLKKLAHQQGNEFYVDHDGFHWHPLRLRQVPLREFIWYSDPGRGDVLTVNVEVDITRKKAEVTKKSKDPITKKVEEHKASNKDTKRDGLAYVALEPYDDLKRGKIRAGVHMVPTKPGDLSYRAQNLDKFSYKDDPSSSRKSYLYRPIEYGMSMCVGTGALEADNKYKGDAMGAVKVTLTAVGDPTMLGKTLVRLSNVGKRLSGSYYVTEVVHTLEPGHYAMKLKMRSDGLGEAAKKTTAFDDGIPEVLHEKSAAKVVDPNEGCVPAPHPDLGVHAYTPVTPKGQRDPRPGYMFNDNEALDSAPVTSPAGKQVATYYKPRPKFCDAPVATEKVVTLEALHDLKSAKLVAKTRDVAAQHKGTPQQPAPQDAPAAPPSDVKALLDQAAALHAETGEEDRD